jgi:anti-anti-sigma factor
VLENGGITVELEREDDRVSVIVRGEVDLASADDLAATLDDLPAECDVRIDVSGVPFLDSTGLSILIRQSMRRREAGGSLSLRHPNANLRRLLEFCCLDHLIDAEERPPLS